MNDSTAPDIADRIVFVDTPPAYRSPVATVLTVLLVIGGTVTTGIGAAVGIVALSDLLARPSHSEAVIILAFGSAYLLPGAMMLLIALWLCLPPAVRSLHCTPAPTTTMLPAEEP